MVVEIVATLFAVGLLGQAFRVFDPELDDGGNRNEEPDPHAEPPPAREEPRHTRKNAQIHREDEPGVESKVAAPSIDWAEVLAVADELERFAEGLKTNGWDAADFLAGADLFSRNAGLPERMARALPLLHRGALEFGGSLQKAELDRLRERMQTFVAIDDDALQKAGRGARDQSGREFLAALFGLLEIADHASPTETVLATQSLLQKIEEQDPPILRRCKTELRNLKLLVEQRGGYRDNARDYSDSDEKRIAAVVRDILDRCQFSAIT